MKALKDVLGNSLSWKILVIVLGYFFALVNLVVSPADIAPILEDADPYHASRVKAGGFALITAIALFAGLIPTDNKKWDKLVDGIARLLGVISAFGAGWYVLDSETQGNPGLYIYGVVILTGSAIVAVAIIGGLWALVTTGSNKLAAAIDRAILYVGGVIGSSIVSLAGRLRRKRATDD